LTLPVFTEPQLMAILKRAAALKKNRRMQRDLSAKRFTLIFEKPSTRTRVVVSKWRCTTGRPWRFR